MYIQLFQVWPEKNSERQKKAGNQEFCKTCNTCTLSFTHSGQLNNFCFHLYDQNSHRVETHILSAPNRGKRNKNTFQTHISTKWVEKCSVTRL